MNGAESIGRKNGWPKSNVFRNTWDRLSVLLIPLAATSEEAASKARLLLKIVVAMMVATVIGFVAALFEPKNDVVITASFYSLVFTSLVWFIILLRKGKVLVAGWVLVIFIWLIVACATLFFGGLRSQIPVVFVVIIMFMGSFLGGRAAVILALVTIGFLGLVALLESYNAMPPQLAPDYSPLNAWSGLCIGFLLMSVLLHNSLTSIRESEERYQLAMHGSAAGLWDWNILTNEMYYAPRFKEMLGYSPNEFPYDYFSFSSTVVHPEDYEPMTTALNAHLASPQNKYDVEFRLRTRSGEYRWFHTRGEAVRNNQQKPYRMVGSIVDITKRKLAEESLALKNEELLKINIELDRFVYSASHDLRAPIASLLGLVEVARMEKGTTSIQKILDMQERSLLKLDKFIFDIVSYSRNNRIGVEIEEIDFTALLDDTYDLLHHMEQVKEIKKAIEIDPNISFYSDKKRISIVLNNLISNAIKYNDFSKTDTFIKTVVKKSENGVSIHVLDSGEGIDNDHIPKIFDMFYRASQRSSGSGIGLYIVKEVVHKLHGTIEVRSQKFHGTEFIVRLPDLKRFV